MPQFRPLSETKFINDANLIGYYPFEGNSTDSSSSGHNGTDTAITYSLANGKFGQGAGFNGTSSRISVPFDSIGTGIRTFNFYLQTTSNVADGPTIFFLDTADTNTNQVSVRLLGSGEGASAGKLRVFLRGAAGENVYRDSSTVLNDGIYRMITVVIDATSKTINIYVNRILDQGAQTGSTLSSLDTTGTMSLGGFSTYYFGMNLDELSIFSRALSASEVNELYQGMTLGEYLPNSNTKLLLHLNGNSTDSSGNGNNGTDTAITYSLANGKFGQGAGFNGTSSNIAFSSVPVDISGDFTVALWAKKTVKAGSNNNDRFLSIVIGTNSQNAFQFITDDTSGKYGAYLIRSNSVIISQGFNSRVDDVWENIIFTMSGTTGKFYFNGNNIAASGSITVAPGTTAGYHIGQRGDGVGSTMFNGSMDEVKIENYAWTPQQVAKYYTMRLGRFGII